MKRFLVFSGENFEQRGGWGDYDDSFDTFDEALAVASAKSIRGKTWSHVVDAAIGKVIWPVSIHGMETTPDKAFVPVIS